MRRLTALALVALVLVAGCGGESAPTAKTERFAFVELPAPTGWVSAAYANLNEAGFNLFPYPDQNEMVVGLFSRGATGAWSAVSASSEGAVGDWLIAASFARPADALILPALTANLRDEIAWSGAKPELTKISDDEFAVSGETETGHRYLRTFTDATTIVVVMGGTSATDHTAFEGILALVKAAPSE
jgi:hypothetical protein